MREKEKEKEKEKKTQMRRDKLNQNFHQEILYSLVITHPPDHKTNIHNFMPADGRQKYKLLILKIIIIIKKKKAMYLSITKASKAENHYPNLEENPETDSMKIHSR